MSILWLHCNNCQLRNQPNIKFYLTECGHLKCERCASRMMSKDGKIFECQVCKSSCQIVPISSDLKPELQSLFRPLTETFDKLKEIYMFQDANTRKLINNLSSKYNLAKKEILKSHKFIDELRRENQKLKAALEMKENMSSMNSTAINGTLCSSANFSFLSPIPPTVNNGDNIQKKPGFPKRVIPGNYRHHPNVQSSMDSTMENDNLHPSTMKVVSVSKRPLLTPTHGHRMQPSWGGSSKEQTSLSSLPMAKLLLNRRPSHNNGRG